MIQLRARTSGLSALDQVAKVLNFAVDEIEAVFNRIGVVRSAVSRANKDYFRFDSTNEKLYLETIEGKTFEITITEV